MIKRALSLFPIAFALATTAVAQERVWIDIEEDDALAASYWPWVAPRAGVLMLHGCMADRTGLTTLAEAFAAAGYSVLTYDMFSHGESRTPRLAMNTREGHDAILSRVSADLMRAHHVLRTAMDAPASTPTVLVLSGCTVAWSAEFLAATPEIDRLVLFSGVPNSAGRIELTERPGLAVLGVTAAADARHTDLMRQLIEASSASNSELILLDQGGHGATALLAAGGAALVDRIVDWVSVHSSDTIEQVGGPGSAAFEWAVDPGEGRFGYVRASTSERDLGERYGARAVRTADLYLAEGFCTPGTVLFPGTPWRAEVAWADSARTRPAFVRVDGTEGSWRTLLGVGLGTTVVRLAELAGEPVTFGGFGWDYGGGLHWKEGDGRLVLRLMPDSASYRRLQDLAASGDPRAEALFGERTVRSDQPLVDELRIVVVEMRMEWNFPAIERGCE